MKDFDKNYDTARDAQKAMFEYAQTLNEKDPIGNTMGYASLLGTYESLLTSALSYMTDKNAKEFVRSIEDAKNRYAHKAAVGDILA